MKRLKSGSKHRSHPVIAENPSVSQPEFEPDVMSLRPARLAWQYGQVPGKPRTDLPFGSK